EIAGEHRGRWDVGDGVRRIRPLQRSLITSEKEQLVLTNGSTDGPAKLVALQRVAFCGKEISRVEDSVSYEFEHVAMEGISSRFCDGIDGGRRMIAILSWQLTRFHLELLECIGKWQGQVEPRRRIIVIASIQKEEHSVARSTGDRNDYCRIISG